MSNSQYTIGDQIVERESKRRGNIIDILEERDSNTGEITYSAVKIKFPDGDSDWMNTDRVSLMLVENDCTNIWQC
jgi:hypothetical protein